MVRSVVFALVFLTLMATNVAAAEHGRVAMPTSIVVAVILTAGAAFFAIVFAVTAPRPGGHPRPEQHSTGEYAAGLAVVVGVALLALAQFLPWGALEFTGGDAQRLYPWGYSSDLSGSGSWFGVDGAGHIDLKVAMVLHYVAFIALLPVILLVWRRPDGTRRTAGILAGLATVHAGAYFIHMDGASAAVNDARFGTSWGGWVAMLGILAIATATLLVSRFSSAVRPPVPTPIFHDPLAVGVDAATPAGAGWAANVLDRAAQPTGQPRWAGAATARPAAASPMPPAPWDPPAQEAPAPMPQPRSDLVSLRCPKCSTMVEALRGVRPICPGCGFGRP